MGGLLWHVLPFRSGERSMTLRSAPVALDQIAAAGTAAICSTVASELQRNLRLESTIRQLEQAQGATMKKLLLTSTALVIGGQAFAADLPVKAPRIAAPVAYCGQVVISEL